MSKAIRIVERALEAIRVHSPLNPAPPETKKLGVEYLADLLNDWEAENLALGATAPTDEDDDIEEPSGSRYGITQNLAVRLATALQTTPSRHVQNEANKSYIDLRAKFEVIDIPDSEVVPTTAEGAGNRRGIRY